MPAYVPDEKFCEWNNFVGKECVNIFQACLQRLSQEKLEDILNSTSSEYYAHQEQKLAEITLLKKKFLDIQVEKAKEEKLVSRVMLKLTQSDSHAKSFFGENAQSHQLQDPFWAYNEKKYKWSNLKEATRELSPPELLAENCPLDV